MMLAEDREGRFVEMLARIANSGGADLPFELRLHLPHVLGSTFLDRRLDPLLVHGLDLVGGPSELGDWIVVQTLVPHHDRASALQPAVRVGDIVAEGLGNIGVDDRVIERSASEHIAFVWSLPTVPASDTLLDPVIVGDEYVIRIPDYGYEMGRCGFEDVAEAIGKAAMLKIDAIVGKVTALDPSPDLVRLVPRLLAGWEPIELIDAAEEALEPVIARARWRGDHDPHRWH